LKETANLSINEIRHLKTFRQLYHMKKISFELLALLFSSIIAISQPAAAQSEISNPKSQIIPGAERMEVYLPLLKGKAVAVFANQTSMVKNTHLVDTLLKSGIKIVKIFGPEHGFRGTADAGEHVTDAKDKKTGIPVVSLYGDHKKPTAADLKGVDILVFDIQDVGVRFYTFISSLEYYLQSATAFNKPVIVLDRPNPNGFYVNGPVLDKRFKSFIGTQEVPIVYGMTVGEYAWMIAQEGYIENTMLYDFTFQKNNATANTIAYDYVKGYKAPEFSGSLMLTVITCKNYDHNSKYILPVMPSPNLKSMQSIYLYPSTCFFEGTVMSEGRGTDAPFQIFGHPSLPKNLYAFTPAPNAGAKSSKCFNQQCYGWNLGGTNEEVLKKLNKKIQLKYFIDAYKLFPGKDSFFLKNNFINKLAGNDFFMQQVKQGKTEADIRKSWQPSLLRFKAIRKKYLLYKDFE
jgi:uncharacterized protein YbbC (DUF1343 family)